MQAVFVTSGYLPGETDLWGSYSVGVKICLSEILGHTKVALTLQLYAHSSMETKQKELAKMDAFL